MSPYELGVALAKTANLMPNTGSLTGGVMGNVPRLQPRAQSAPMGPQAMSPGAMPNAPLITGAAQPAIQAQVPGANQAMPAGGGSPLQQMPQNPASSLVPKRAADYQIPGQLGSFSSAVFSPEAQGQRSVEADTRKKLPSTKTLLERMKERRNPKSE